VVKGCQGSCCSFGCGSCSARGCEESEEDYDEQMLELLINKEKKMRDLKNFFCHRP
jgi:hypothetical protein